MIKIIELQDLLFPIPSPTPTLPTLPTLPVIALLPILSILPSHFIQDYLLLFILSYLIFVTRLVPPSFTIYLIL